VIVHALWHHLVLPPSPSAVVGCLYAVKLWGCCMTRRIEMDSETSVKWMWGPNSSCAAW
jgi:hypothetical protein